MADENVSVDAQVSQVRVLTRDDELRLFALQMATKDHLRLDKLTAEETRDRTLKDARAYYDFLKEAEQESTDG